MIRVVLQVIQTQNPPQREGFESYKISKIKQETTAHRDLNSAKILMQLNFFNNAIFATLHCKNSEIFGEFMLNS